MPEPGRFHDATLVRIRQPDRTGGVTLPVAHDRGRDLRLWCEFFRLALPSRGRMRAVLTCRADLVLAADATFQDGELLT